MSAIPSWVTADTPRFIFGFIFLVILCFIYWPSIKRWRDNREENKTNEYTKSIGYLMCLVENWHENGTGNGMPHQKPREYNAYWKLENLSLCLTVDQDIRNKIKDFLKNFRTSNQFNAIFSIKTVFETEPEAKKALPEINKLAKELSNQLGKN